MAPAGRVPSSGITADAHARNVRTSSRAPVSTYNTHPASSVPHSSVLETTSVWLDRGSLAAVHQQQQQTAHHCRQQNNGKSVPKASQDKAQSGAGRSMAVHTSGACPHGRSSPALRGCTHRPQRPSRLLRTNTLHRVVSRVWSTSNGVTRGSVVLWVPSAPGCCQPAHLPGTR